MLRCFTLDSLYCFSGLVHKANPFYYQQVPTLSSVYSYTVMLRYCYHYQVDISCETTLNITSSVQTSLLCRLFEVMVTDAPTWMLSSWQQRSVLWFDWRTLWNEDHSDTVSLTHHIHQYTHEPHKHTHRSAPLTTPGVVVSTQRLLVPISRSLHTEMRRGRTGLRSTPFCSFRHQQKCSPANTKGNPCGDKWLSVPRGQTHTHTYVSIAILERTLYDFIHFLARNSNLNHLHCTPNLALILF